MVPIVGTVATVVPGVLPKDSLTDRTSEGDLLGETRVGAERGRLDLAGATDGDSRLDSHTGGDGRDGGHCAKVVGATGAARRERRLPSEEK